MSSFMSVQSIPADHNVRHDCGKCCRQFETEADLADHRRQLDHEHVYDLTLSVEEGKPKDPCITGRSSASPKSKSPEADSNSPTSNHPKSNSSL